MILQHEPQKVELWYRLRLTKTPAKLVQCRLRWFDNAARRPDGELIKELLLPARAIKKCPLQHKNSAGRR